MTIKKAVQKIKNVKLWKENASITYIHMNEHYFVGGGGAVYCICYSLSYPRYPHPHLFLWCFQLSQTRLKVSDISRAFLPVGFTSI
jgi:hypothetical protein